jgi:hypothetical protein
LEPPKKNILEIRILENSLFSFLFKKINNLISILKEKISGRILRKDIRLIIYLSHG